jgi:ABC-2 type transport system ATP-binding protein
MPDTARHQTIGLSTRSRPGGGDDTDTADAVDEEARVHAVTADRARLAAPTPRDVAISIRGVVKTYDGVRVVDGLDLDVQHGECVALLGPNGSGKTTTVEICEGFRQRDSGAVAVLGEDPWRAGRGWRARVGIVAQSDLGGFDLTVREALNHFACYHAAPRTTEELIAAVGLQDKARTRVPALSGGQRRRLDVALGVQGRPELLFLDEPTTGFDPAARRQFWSLLDSVKASGTTILLTTHYLDEAAHLADRVAVIAAGRLLEVAEPQALGNRMSMPATVSWTDADGNPHEILTPEPTSVLRKLIGAQSAEIDDLSVRRPSLEDVYLDLVEAVTPRELR